MDVRSRRQAGGLPSDSWHSWWQHQRPFSMISRGECSVRRNNNKHWHFRWRCHFCWWFESSVSISGRNRICKSQYLWLRCWPRELCTYMYATQLNVQILSSSAELLFCRDCSNCLLFATWSEKRVLISATGTDTLPTIPFFPFDITLTYSGRFFFFFLFFSSSPTPTLCCKYTKRICFLLGSDCDIDFWFDSTIFLVSTLRPNHWAFALAV